MNVPQIEPITSMAKDQKSVLAKLENGPVFLVQRSRPAAVLLSVREYERMAARLDRLESVAEARRISARLASGQEETIPHDELKRRILENRIHGARADVAD